MASTVETPETPESQVTKLTQRVEDLRTALRDIASSSGGETAKRLRTKARLALIRFE